MVPVLTPVLSRPSAGTVRITSPNFVQQTVDVAFKPNLGCSA
jgi:hypothetical protein